MRLPTIYVSGAYTCGGKNSFFRRLPRLLTALYYSWKLWRMGFGVFCPHANTAFGVFASLEKDIPYQHFIAYDLKMLKHHDALFLLPNWEKSKGAIREREYAVSLGIPVFRTLDEAQLYLAHRRTLH